MPAPNDLTPEEEQEFIQHGRQPMGQGREPLDDGSDDGQGQQGQQQGADEGQEGAGEGQQGQQSQQGAEQPSRHRPDGTFKSKAEYDAEVAAWEAAQNGQAQGQQGQQQGQQGDGQPRMVPHEALHAERQRAAAAIRQAQLATARMNALINARQGQGGEQQIPQMPDPSQDPLGYLQAMEQRIARFEQERAQENEYRQVDMALEQDEQLFALNVPDYDQASDYYVASRARELLAFHAPDQARRIMEQEARAIAQQAWQRGQSAAEVVYSLAQARGWQPGQGQQQGQPQGQQQGQQQGHQPQRQGPTAQQRIASINQGQQQSRSLSGGGAAGQRTEQLNAEALLNMSDEEFEEYLKLGEKGANARFAAIG